MNLTDSTKIKHGVVVVAGGSGTRMRNRVPKQFLDLSGKPVLVHSLLRFLEFDPGITVVVVLAASHHKYWEQIVTSGALPPGIRLAEGGVTRFESVQNGIKMLKDVDLIGIHDAVRPLVSVKTLERCYESAGTTGSGIPVIGMEDTVRILRENGRSEHLERSLLRRIQTPQVFHAGRIREAYNQPFHPAFTDDASVYESLYGDVCLVPGNSENIKITTATDLMLASMIIDRLHGHSQDFS
jgi:2-C-methyl-D-erythritol 4-phosphate cytidylyltransferase